MKHAALGTGGISVIWSPWDPLGSGAAWRKMSILCTRADWFQGGCWVPRTNQCHACALHHIPTPQLGSRQPGSTFRAEIEPPPCQNYTAKEGQVPKRIRKGKEQTPEGPAWQHSPCSQGECVSLIACLVPASAGNRLSLCPDPVGLCFYSGTVRREWWIPVGLTGHSGKQWTMNFHVDLMGKRPVSVPCLNIQALAVTG